MSFLTRAKSRAFARSALFYCLEYNISVTNGLLEIITRLLQLFLTLSLACNVMSILFLKKVRIYARYASAGFELFPFAMMCPRRVKQAASRVFELARCG